VKTLTSTKTRCGNLGNTERCRNLD